MESRQLSLQMRMPGVVSKATEQQQQQLILQLASGSAAVG